ncbi:RNA polymerase sigma factor [Sunxiuqinia elliptica]
MEKGANILELINQKRIDGYKYLYANFYPSLCSFASSFFKQNDLVEDIVQDVFIRLWRSDSKFNSTRALKSYLYFSVKNACLNSIRDNSKLSDIDFSSDNEIQAMVLEDKSIEQLLIEEEFYRQIHVAIEKLSPERKRIILLSLEGFSNKEIAEELDISINTVKSLKLRAYSVLRKELSWSVLLFLIKMMK